QGLSKNYIAALGWAYGVGTLVAMTILVFGIAAEVVSGPMGDVSTWLPVLLVIALVGFSSFPLGIAIDHGLCRYGRPAVMSALMSSSVIALVGSLAALGANFSQVML